MKKKKILTIALSLCLAAVIAVGATLAYFTDNTKTKTNVVTTGNVKIQLNDTSDPEDGQVGGSAKVDGAGITYDNIMPGDTVAKLVSVQKLADTQDCYVAIRVDVVDSKEAGKTPIGAEAKKDIMDNIKASAQENDWVCENNNSTDTSAIFYLPTVLTDDEVKELFDTVDIPDDWDNDVANATFDIDVKAAAVQEAHLEAPAMVPVEEGSAVLEPNTSLKRLIDLLTAVDTGDGE